jgi:hypothetical protein
MVIDGWLFYLWLLVVGYSINGYWWLTVVLMVIDGWLFYLWLLVVIL